MIKKKTIINESNIDLYDKYIFDLFITDNVNDIKKDNIYILVNKESEIEDAYNAINYVNIYPGLVTVSLLDLYNVFNDSGIWNYKYFEEKDIEKIKEQLDSIDSDNVYLSIYCNNNHTLFEYNDIVDYYVKKHNKNAYIRFALPTVEDDSDNIKINVFYK